MCARNFHPGGALFSLWHCRSVDRQPNGPASIAAAIAFNHIIVQCIAQILADQDIHGPKRAGWGGARAHRTCAGME
jgi:hypothetical protein